MELLIPGLILVALMVYASTRIKKTAAAAFEAETIEMDDFVIQKPEGFLNNLNGDSKHAFEVYSKEFGGDGAEDIKQGRADLTITKGSTIEKTVADLRSSGDEIGEDITEVIGSTHFRVIEAARVEKGVDLCVTYKLAEKNEKVYLLEAVRLAETPDEFSRKLEVFVASFELK